jgi:group I intron endonuclease
MILYLITNTVNGKRYVGMTTRTLKARWRGHCTGGKRKRTALRRAIDLYGRAAFTMEQIGCAETVTELEAMERQAIISYGTLAADGSGYNETFGGIGFKGKHTEETKASMSDSRKGHTHSFGNTNAKGSKRTPEAIARTVAGNKGRKQPLEERAKRSVIMFSRPRTPDWNAAISAGKKGKPGKPLTSECKAKLSAAMTGRIISLETREKMSAARLATVARKRAEAAMTQEAA